MNDDAHDAPLRAAEQTILQAAAHAASESEALVAAKCLALLRGYHRRYQAEGLTPIQVEQIYTAPLVNQAGKRISRSRTFSIAGRVDALLQSDDGKLFLLDHKTTSQEIGDPGGVYWRQLVIEGQPRHYLWLLWLNGVKVDGAIWDAVRKPQIAPKRLTKSELEEIRSTGLYCGQVVAPTDLETAERTGAESVDMYRARLEEDCTYVRPDWYFQRRPITLLRIEILDYAKQLWDHGQDVLRSRRYDYWDKNSGACLLYGTPCQFLGLCSGCDEIQTGRWRTRKNVHPELPELEGDGRNVLTHSRIRCFQMCRRKHYYQYELGIERIDEEEKEAIRFGRLWHEALAAWWTSQRRK